MPHQEILLYEHETNTASEFSQKYELSNLIAVGGMAEIYTAVCKRTMNKIIIKKILPDQAEDHNFKRMFLEEAKILTQLNHENIIKILDFGKVDNTYFIALEYIAGKNMRVILDKAEDLKIRFPVPLAIHIVVKVLKGLDYLHNVVADDKEESRIIHRDVTPDNVIVSLDGHIKIIDFGIAKETSKSGFTKTGMLKGKLGYIAPEQVFGKNIDERVDLYSVGVMLYEIITGQKMMNLDLTSSFRDDFRKFKAKSPRKIDPALPKELEKIIMKAIDRDPNKRYQSAREFQLDLIEFVNPENYKSIVAMDLAKFVTQIISQFTQTNKATQISKVCTQPSDPRIRAKYMQNNQHAPQAQGFNPANAATIVGKLSDFEQEDEDSPERTIIGNIASKRKFLNPRRVILMMVILLMIGVNVMNKVTKNLENAGALTMIADVVHLTRGNSAFNSGDLDKAFFELSKVRSNLFRTPDLILKLGKLERSTKNDEGALNELSRFDDYVVDTANIFKEKGDILKEQGNTEEAITNYKKFIVLAPNDPAATIVEKYIESVEGQNSALVSKDSKIEPVKSNIIKTEKITAQTYIAQGDEFYKKAKYKDAIKKYLKAMEEKPSEKLIYLKVGRSYGKLYDYANALSFYNRVKDMDGNNKEALQEMGVIYAEIGEVDQAVYSLRKYIDLETDTNKRAQYETFVNELMN
ncbi:MAG: protein kinase [Pseudomonadota bacterium]